MNKDYNARALKKAVVFPHAPQKSGGPGTFQIHLMQELSKIEWESKLLEDSKTGDLVLIVGGTRKILRLLRLKWKGVPIVYRLDGLRWEHRRSRGKNPNWIEYEIQNFIMVVLRKFIATHVIYQTDFVKQCWHSKHGNSGLEEYVIHNGTDLKRFYPNASSEGTSAPVLLCAEGTFPHELDSIQLFKRISKECVELGFLSSVEILGEIDEVTKTKLNSMAGINARGARPRGEMPERMRQADIFLSLELNPACPNSVIEAMASGLAVVGYNTGALEELLGDGAAYLADYGGDSWLTYPSDHGALIEKIKLLSECYQEVGTAARALAEERYSRKTMTDNYLSVFMEAMNIK